ncbi:hypothetical protein P9112_003173 [Eukaryota sp. TZLM1-RC]
MLSMSIVSHVCVLLILCFAVYASQSSVLFLYTGGTIGMKKINGSFAPVPGYLAQLLSDYPNINNPDLGVTYTILEYSPLLDSSNINSTHWSVIARDIEKYYTKYDGFVVIHGTDTLAYTASALSFLLENLDKTVIVTGSQIPLGEKYSDGWNNLIGSMLIAGRQEIPEVSVFFDNKLLRGNRVRKYSNWDLSAFTSEQFPILGLWGGSFNLYPQHLLPKPTKPFALASSDMNSNVAIVYLFPSIQASYLESILSSGIRGLIIMSFGMGNGPDENKEFMQVLKQANDNGVILIDASQCFRGFVDLGTYATGSSMAKVGCIGALDMTPEAAFTKLSWLLGRGLSTEQIKKLIVQNLRGEVTVAEEVKEVF